MKLLGITLLTILFSYFSSCQENAGTNVAPALQECYNTTRFVTRDFRLPSTINILVELIRKIEEKNPSQDARELSYQLLHRFRQDGIRRTTKDIDSSQGLPYSPKGWEAYKNRVQLTKITPGNAINFNNDSLSALEACSLHFMISSTIETNVRGDESTVCARIAHYTSRIHKRQIHELTEADLTSKSTCPIESGVIYTKWGAVKAGLLIAGIASGYQPNPLRIDNNTLESSYASTIAGELSEDALNQLSTTKTVGNKGGWNNTVEPKYYFLDQSSKEALYFTDAEIRGSLDGLYLALNVQDWRSKANNIKISQILDLYYSRGVFNHSSRACNRKTLIYDLILDDRLVAQTVSFSQLLDVESSLSYSPKKENLPTMARSAIESLRNYITSNLQDLDCSAESDLIERVSTDVLIFIDTAWNYQIIQPLVSYILENIDINKYESSYTIFDGANCDIIVNKSRSILDFYEQFNLTQHQKYPTGFDYNKIIQKAENIYKAKLDNATDLTGQSMIVLMLPHNTPTTSQSGYVQSKRNDFKTVLPDVRVIVGGSGSKTSYDGLVTSPNNDIFIISENTEDSQIKETGRIMIDRFKKIPRSTVNPACGSSLTSSGPQNFELTQYVEPTGVNYHKISPNYFYKGQSLKIRGQGMGTLIVCTSRTDTNPRANSTGITCKNITADEISMDISNYCADQTVTECSPIYISAEGATSNVRCSDKTCRFPDSIKYSIVLENAQCSSSSKTLFTSVLMFLVFVVMRL